MHEALSQDALTQAPGVGIAHVIDPALHRSVKFGKTDFAVAIIVPVRTQTAREFHYVARLDATVRGVNDKAEPRDAVRARDNLRGRFVHREAQAIETGSDSLLPFIQLALAIAEQSEIIHVTQH